jgi:pimeloyl-ACP methyl ester carboxylesterase
MIAQLLALNHKHRVDRLVLLSTHFGGPEIVPPTPEAISVVTPPRGTPPEQIVRRAMQVITAPGFAENNPDAIEELVRLSAVQPTPKAVFSAQLQALMQNDRSGRVSQIQAPVLVIHGDSDSLIPSENGRRLAERIPGARLSLLKGCGHMPMWEQPDVLSEHVLAFFD